MASSAYAFQCRACMHLHDIDDYDCAPSKIAQILAVLEVHKQNKLKGKIQSCMSASLRMSSCACQCRWESWCHCCKGKGTYITMKHWSSAQAQQLPEGNYSNNTVNTKERCLQHWETWTRTPQTEGAALTTTQVDLYERAALEQYFAKLQIRQLLAQHGSAQQTATYSSKQLMLTHTRQAA